MVSNWENERTALPDYGDAHDTRDTGDGTQTVVGVFKDDGALERAYTALLDAGFDRQQVSLAGRGTDAADEIPNQDASDRAAAKAAGGAAIGGLGGGALALLAGATALAIPGIGPVLVVAGGALAGAAAGGWLGSAGISASEDVEKRYGELIRQGNYLVFVSVDGLEESRSAQRLLKDNGADEIERFSKAINPADVSERPGSKPTPNAP
jgi:hypothetical protein